MANIDNYDFKGKKAIVRVDFNVPLDDNGNIIDASQERLDIQAEIRRKRADEQLEKEEKMKRERFEAMEKIVNGAKGILRRSDLNRALQQALNKKRATVDGYIRSWIADGIIKEDANKNVVLIANNITGNQQNLPLF